ncbi:unannotated protein [freshwater metagenome]|uniref:Unannotated protein n=1 Tax=freshwater metagenome TaxID=449393 RepID=A0A6J6L432_9ZZZZ|nr:DUF3710 domain-containing protein [Actinomycetota bacterium]
MTQGPLEFSSDLDTSSMLDLGAVFLPNIPGLEVHLDLDPRSGKGKSVSLHLNMTIAEVQIFAAAVNDDLWATMRDAISSGLRDQKVDCTVEMGRFGTEIHAVMPTVDLDGNAHVQPVRFVGVRGSRWLVRAVISGDGALLSGQANPDAGPDIDEVISQLVINRGDEPIPPGERLALRSPSAPTGDSSQGSQSDSNDAKFGNFHIQL